MYIVDSMRRGICSTISPSPSRSRVDKITLTELIPLTPSFTTPPLI